MSVVFEILQQFGQVCIMLCIQQWHVTVVCTVHVHSTVACHCWVYMYHMVLLAIVRNCIDLLYSTRLESLG